MKKKESRAGAAQAGSSSFFATPLRPPLPSFFRDYGGKNLFFQ
jgi:hypothetical protein